MMPTLGWAESWRIARRDLTKGFRGLRLLLVCLFLGVATLATIGSLTTAITQEMTARGRDLLGGDIQVGMTQRRGTDQEREALSAYGQVSDTIRTRAMARRTNSSEGAPDAVLTEIKGVDNHYPLYGTLTLTTGAYRPLFADEVVIGQALSERLLLRVGDSIRYGDASFRILGIIADEPDRVGEGFTLGPVAIVSLEGLARTGLLAPGALFETKYRIKLHPQSDPKSVVDKLQEQFASQSWEFKDRDRAAPGAVRFFERMGQFLALIGLAALVIAGIGVSNGVSSYLGMKRATIATLKILGATSGDIARIYLLEIGAVAFFGVMAGVLTGALLPLALIGLTQEVLPVAPGFAIHPLPLITAAIYGLLIAFAFALPPLARARLQPAAAQFRGGVESSLPIDRHTALQVACAGALVIGLALATAREPLFAAAVLGAVAGVLLVLLGIGALIRRVAVNLPRPRRPLLRLALANLHRPGAQTVALVIALGLALTLFVTLAAIQTSLNTEISRAVPARAPNQFVLDIPADERERFISVVKREAPDAKLNLVPSLRGTIVAYDGKRVADMKELPEGAWFLRGERGVTYAQDLPEGSEITDGQWWPRDYQGPPLISLDEKAADTLDIGVGDSLTVSILGREIEARVASLRQINWDTMGFNYVLVFSPNTLQAAPHSLTSTIEMEPSQEGAVSRALLAAFPSASIIAVSEVIGQVRTILDQMATAILLSASVAILAGIAVLVGAIAASRASRSYDSVILKTLGATRWQILTAQGLEYAVLAGMLCLLALGLGSAAAWFVIVKVFAFTWAPNWPVVLLTLAAGAAITLGIGLIGSLPLLAVRPATALRRL